MISAYSVAMGIFWFTISVGLLLILRQRLPFLMKHSALLLLSVTILTIVRILLPLDLISAYVIQSFYMYPSVKRLLCQTSFAGRLLWQWLLIGWGAGSVLVLIAGSLSSACFAVAMKQLPRMEDPVTDRIAQTLGFDPARVVVAEGVPMAMAVGLIRPMIFLPPMELPEEATAWVLRHEITHIRLHDNWWKLLGLVLQAALWWNPVAYFFVRSLDSILEMRCDEALLRDRSQKERAAYVTALRDVAKTHCRKKQRYPSAALPFAQTAAEKELKLRANLALNRKAKGLRESMALLAACIALFIASYFVIIQPASFPPEEDLAGVIEITPENSYLVHKEDGTYDLWVDGAFYTTHAENELRSEPLCDLEIREEE